MEEAKTIQIEKSRYDAANFIHLIDPFYIIFILD